MARTTAASVESNTMSALASFKERARAARKEHDLARSAIRDDPMTSDLGKRERLEALDKQTRAKLDGIKSEQASYLQTLRERVASEVRGHQSQDTNSVLLRRDAADRARKITEKQDAMDTLNDAIANGDTVLAQAIGGRARARLWGSVAEAYEAAYPELADSEAALAYLDGLTSDGAFNVSNSMTFASPA